jgi:6-phosphogluconolactonase (cycloisomerase 2 family)
MSKYLLVTLLLIICNKAWTQLSFLETFKNLHGGIDMLHHPTDMVVDGNGNMYILGNQSLIRLNRDSSTGQIDFIEGFSKSEYPGLLNANRIISTNDNNFFYVTGAYELLLFAKDIDSDKLSYAQSIRQNDTIDIGSPQFTSIAITPNSQFLFLTNLFARKYGLNMFKINPKNGKLTFINKVADTYYINGMACSDNFLVTTAFGSNDTSLYVYQRSELSDSLFLVTKFSRRDGIQNPSNPVFSTDFRFLYIFDDCKLKSYEFDNNSGSLLFIGSYDLLENIPFLNNYSNYTLNTLINSDNQYLYFSDHSNLLVFKRDTISGRISFIQHIIEDDATGSISQISRIVNNDGTSEVFLVCTYDNKIILLKRNHISGILDFKQIISKDQGRLFGLDNVKDILISNDDKHLYTLSSGYYPINQFLRNNNGTLSFRRSMHWNEFGPAIGPANSFIIHPLNGYIYLSSSGMYGLRIMKRDSLNGDLIFFKSYTDSAIGISDEVISEISIPDDGENLYAATWNYIITYEIDKKSAELKYLSRVEITDIAGGLKGNKIILSSHDGKNIYTYSSSYFYDNGLSIYSRKSDGTITHIKNITHNESLFTLGNPHGMCISPDGEYLYVAGASIYCFKRNLVDGSLTFLYKHDISETGIHDRYNLESIVISNDGRYFFGVSKIGKMMFSFHRNTSNGKLKLRQNYRYTNNPVYSNNGPKAIFSNDMKNLYLISQYENILNVYNTEIPLGIESKTDLCLGDTILLSIEDDLLCKWSTGDTTNSIKVTNPGEYSVWVEDKSGRVGMAKTEVILRPLPVFSISFNQALSNKEYTHLQSIIMDNNYPFEYYWNTGSTEPNIIVKHSEIPGGKFDYTLYVTNKYGCKSYATITLPLSDFVDDPKDNENEAFFVYPNPFRNIIFINTGKLKGELEIRIMSLNGKVLKQFNRSAESNEALNLDDLKSGSYIFEVSRNIENNKILLMKY